MQASRAAGPDRGEQQFPDDPADPAAIRAALIDQHSTDPSAWDVLVRGDRGAW